MSSTKKVFSRQKTCFVARNTCLSRQNYVATKFILVAFHDNDIVCRDKSIRVATKIFSILSRDKHVFVARNICHDKRFVATEIFCRDRHHFVATSILLSRQKMRLVAAPANDSRQRWPPPPSCLLRRPLPPVCLAVAPPRALLHLECASLMPGPQAQRMGKRD